ncbi:augmin subunit 6 [Tanacetum coccineum]
MKNLPDTVHMLQDVKGDRNCGFPSVAVALGLSEDHWPRIQSDLVRELEANDQNYKKKEAWISKGGRVGRGAVGFSVTSLGWGELEGIGVDFISSFEGEVENGNDIRFLFDKWVGEIAFGVGNEIGLEVLEGGFVRTLRSYKSYCKMLLSSLIVGIVGGGRFKRVVISRGPKAFDKVWPIFDSVRSSDFRKVVQKIISELESQGALPKSHSRLSSLANCYGPRFVELLWQLFVHALREVHRRTYAADVVLNPLPASLTNVAFSHAATLLPVTKLWREEDFSKMRRQQRQAMWSNLAHEMTAEYRRLCAEEAYLQQELEKLHDLRNKVKMDGEPWDELVSRSSQNSHLVQRATRLWDSLLSRKSK